MLLRLAFLLAFALSVSFPAWAQSDDTSPYSEATLVSDRAAVAPGETVEVALRIAHDPEWHSYWQNAGDSGQATRLTWELPEGVEAGEIRWPYPMRHTIAGFTTYGYEDEVLLLVPVTIPADYAEATLPLRARADWLICADVCLPAYEEVELTLAVGEPAEDAAWTDRMNVARALLPQPMPDGWTALAEATSDGYRLAFTTPDAPEAVEGSYFYVGTGATLAHAPTHAAALTDDGFALELERSPFTRTTADRLEGTLLAPDGATWPGGARALVVDASVSGGAVAASDDAGVLGADGAALSLWLALGLAFLGGMLLNLMPCVFPILSIKILGFAQGHGPTAMRRHGLLFGAGVLVSFWVLAGGLIALRAGGEAIGWGFQLQNPLIVAGLAVLLFALGLSLMGLFEIGLGLSGKAGQLDRGEGSAGAFGSGVLATVVATPCTAPFMGAALGWALAQPAASSLAVFTALGAGMALPYMLLSFFPAWLRRLPKPGPWMVTLKQVLAFGLFATAIWLIWVFGLQTGMDGVALLLGALTLVAFAAWLVHRWTWTAIGTRLRVVTRGLAVGALALALVAVLSGSRQVAEPLATANGWEAFSPERVEDLRAAGEPVFIDFTAAWCLSCQVNKRVALDTRAVTDAFAARGVNRMRADWTHYDPVITEALESFGRSGVPLYVLYPPGGEPILLPEILTPGLVLSALDRLDAVASLQ